MALHPPMTQHTQVRVKWYMLYVRTWVMSLVPKIHHIGMVCVYFPLVFHLITYQRGIRRPRFGSSRLLVRLYLVSHNMSKNERGSTKQLFSWEGLTPVSSVP